MIGAWTDLHYILDFVCDKRGEKLYVQVTYLLASEETVNREFGAYDNIRDNSPK